MPWKRSQIPSHSVISYVPTIIFLSHKNAFLHDFLSHHALTPTHSFFLSVTVFFFLYLSVSFSLLLFLPSLTSFFHSISLYLFPILFKSLWQKLLNSFSFSYSLPFFVLFFLSLTPSHSYFISFSLFRLKFYFHCVFYPQIFIYNWLPLPFYLMEDFVAL